MKERTLLSVGIDLGTTTTQMIVSRLQIENTAGAFSVPRMEITGREILYRGTIHETPLINAHTLDAAAIEALIRQEYSAAGITPQQVETGAVIITGETARKENARQVLEALSDLAGAFVVATAGPALESVLAAKGAGADRMARELGTYVLHMDIGGGTSNLALFDPDGELVDTGCLNIGGRLLKFSADGAVLYRSSVLDGMDVSDPVKLARELTHILEQAAGLADREPGFARFITDKAISLPSAPVMLSFSGGVADLIRSSEENWLRYGDLGVLLGRAIRESRLCRARYLLGRETIRATVIGAGSHTTELSGSTVYVSHGDFPIHDLPVIRISERELQTGRNKDGPYAGETAAIALEGISDPSFQDVNDLAEDLVKRCRQPDRPMVVVLERDMAKALGQALQLRLGPTAGVICLDGVHAPDGSYLDILEPLEHNGAVPVVVKTLAFQ